MKLFGYIIGLILSNIAYFALHITGGNSFPSPLSEKEESEALEKMKEGDMQARQKLIEHNLRLVAHLSKKYYSAVRDQDDIISIGTVGLIKGIDSFNPEKNYKLVTYISRCIENEILMVLRSNKKCAKDILLSDTVSLDKNGEEILLEDVINITSISTPDDYDKKEKIKVFT